ncbi:hypothetical protein NQ318_011791 [Aromia moschata]|uniref:Transposase n=1 Tax=Aromia moschata TaxID=1265417 RepID=A0AAV8Y4H2_9CUCU|nr:hypothetical protein NQ318_011791 [Aromia moschata]
MDIYHMDEKVQIIKRQTVNLEKLDMFAIRRGMDQDCSMRSLRLRFLVKLLWLPTTSLREVAQQTGLSHESVRKVLKLHKFHPYKLQITQELGDDDPTDVFSFDKL